MSRLRRVAERRGLVEHVHRHGHRAVAQILRAHRELRVDEVATVRRTSSTPTRGGGAVLAQSVKLALRCKAQRRLKLFTFPEMSFPPYRHSRVENLGLGLGELEIDRFQVVDRTLEHESLLLERVDQFVPESLAGQNLKTIWNFEGTGKFCSLFNRNSLMKTIGRFWNPFNFYSLP